ncbi:CHAD domain-containing protein [Haloarcula sp. Atlit-7R]|uniref:CHAD domain-containing protein n=1 Tax=Haloarcula sp. Atlit-7R TaxID=2282125 RepID=UPI000EF146E7|nr:CHAD domain-containing protein [Haloarcula sp. Atlit-7R]RLM88764.1 CHAD domain-containing protein [Haloarcula sp. Atlit-7R]
MEYTLQPEERVSEGIKRIIDGKVNRAIEHIDGDMDRHETVHEVRKRCKEVRAAIRLVRPVLPTYSKENAHYRDAGRRISDIRDAQAAIETFDDHIQPIMSERDALSDETLADLRGVLVDRRDRLANEQDLNGRLSAVRADLVEGRNRIDTLPIATEGYDAVAGGLRKSYKRARNRMEDAYDDPEFERFHEWRKRIKYHRYHCRLLRQVWIGPMKARRSELKTLSDVIGDENDLAEFSMMMHDEELFDEATRATLGERITGRRAELHRQGRALGERLFAEHPDQLVDRIGSYWTATREYDPQL